MIMTDEETYKNKKIIISDDKSHLTIDSKEIQVDFDEDAKKYSLYSVLSYTTFATLLDLAKAIVDNEDGGN